MLAVSATYLPAVKCEPILVEEADHLADKVDLQSAAEKIDNGVAACNELVTFSAERTEPNIGFGSGVEFGSVEVEESNEAKVFSTEHLPIEVAVPHALTDDNAVTAENIEHNQLSRANITEGTGIILN